MTAVFVASLSEGKAYAEIIARTIPVPVGATLIAVHLRINVERGLTLPAATG
jgi:hypothetical protein